MSKSEKGRLALKKLVLNSMACPTDVFVHWQKEGALLLDPPYQRGDVWGKRRRQNLIRSMVTRVPIPSVIINDRFDAGWINDERFAVIDGRQRITTILRFLSGDLLVPGEWFGLTGEISFHDLPVVTQRGIRHSSTAISKGQLPDLAAEQEVFELVNFGGIAQGEIDEDED